MSNEKFIKNKLKLITKDNQKEFEHLLDPLEQMADRGISHDVVEIPQNGTTFELSFRSIRVMEDRLVISAKKLNNGLVVNPLDPKIRNFFVDFSGTRAAYLYGFYRHRHIQYGWPYITWNVRTHITHPTNPNLRVYVDGFRARDEIRRMITLLDGFYNVDHIYNRYVEEPLLRFQTGITQNKRPSQIEREWSQGLLESLGFKQVEVFDLNPQQGRWKKIAVHWCKKKNGLEGGYV